MEHEFKQFDTMDLMEDQAEKRYQKNKVRAKLEAEAIYEKTRKARKDGISGMTQAEAYGLLQHLDAQDQETAGVPDYIDTKLNEIQSIDQLDFKLREDIQGCPCCRNVKGYKNSRAFAKDHGIYQHMIKYRKMFKLDRLRPDDLPDDLT